MFWDSVLDPLKSALSYDIVRWIMASTLATFVLTKLLAIFTGSSWDSRQEARVGAMVLLVLVGVFYLPRRESNFPHVQQNVWALGPIQTWHEGAFVP